MPPYLNYEWEMELVVCASVRLSWVRAASRPNHNLTITGSKMPGASNGHVATFKFISMDQIFWSMKTNLLNLKIKSIFMDHNFWSTFMNLIKHDFLLLLKFTSVDQTPYL